MTREEEIKKEIEEINEIERELHSKLNKWDFRESKNVGRFHYLHERLRELGDIKLKQAELKGITEEKARLLKEIEGKIKGILFGKIDWIQVFKDAYESRKGAWYEIGHIQEWRNATDEVLFAFWKQFEKELKQEVLSLKGDKKE